MFLVVDALVVNKHNLKFIFQGNQGFYNNRPGSYYGPSPPQQQLEVVFLYIPEQSVGAVIGSKGQNIKNIMHLSAARIKVIISNVLLKHL